MTVPYGPNNMVIFFSFSKVKYLKRRMTLNLQPFVFVLQIVLKSICFKKNELFFICLFHF